MRSAASRTDPSGSPTVVVCGSPEDTSTSTSTTSASMPRSAPERTRASMLPACRQRALESIAASGLCAPEQRGDGVENPGLRAGRRVRGPGSLVGPSQVVGRYCRAPSPGVDRDVVLDGGKRVVEVVQQPFPFLVFGGPAESDLVALDGIPPDQEQ